MQFLWHRKCKRSEAPLRLCVFYQFTNLLMSRSMEPWFVCFPPDRGNVKNLEFSMEFIVQILVFTAFFVENFV